MKQNFWDKFDKPFYGLAPMAGISDIAFRLMCKKYGADLLYSEMVSSEAIWHNAKFKKDKDSLLKTLKLIRFKEAERPYVVQIFGGDAEHMAYAAEYIASGKWYEDLVNITGVEEKDGFGVVPDGIDINMGCPVRDIIKTGAGSALMCDQENAIKIIKAVKNVVNIPVSVKTRLGWENHEDILEFSKKIEDAGADALCVHGRTYKEGFVGGVDWKMIGKVKKKLNIPVVGNGGIGGRQSTNDYQFINSGLDGYLVGMGACGRPWIFNQLKGEDVKIDNRFIFDNIYEHARIYRDLKGDNMREFRKHALWYLKGLTGVKELKDEFVRVEKFSEIDKIYKSKSRI